MYTPDLLFNQPMLFQISKVNIAIFGNQIYSIHISQNFSTLGDSTTYQAN